MNDEVRLTVWEEADRAQSWFRTSISFRAWSAPGFWILAPGKSKVFPSSLSWPLNRNAHGFAVSDFRGSGGIWDRFWTPSFSPEVVGWPSLLFGSPNRNAPILLGQILNVVATGGAWIMSFFVATSWLEIFPPYISGYLPSLPLHHTTKNRSL